MSTALHIVRRLPPEMQALRNQVLGFDPRAVMAEAIKKGLATPPPPASRPPRARKFATQRERLAARRAAMVAAGLSTNSGKPRKYQRHPELKGLPFKEYRRRLMAKRRQAQTAATTLEA